MRGWRRATTVAVIGTRRRCGDERNGPAHAARAPARLLHRRAARRATTSPSSASCCAPPAWRSSASWSSAASSPHPNTYLGPGKVAEAKAAAQACDANLIACDDELTARQERNLEEALGLPVVDRTTVILDIFASHAGSAEGKLQVELAQLEYNLARMRGPVEPPRAPRRRDRHEGPGRDPDRDRPPPRARPHRGAAPAPRARQGNARGAARRARARGAARRSRSSATPTPASRRC